MSYILEAIKKSEEEKQKNENLSFLNSGIYKSINKNYILYAQNKFLIVGLILCVFLLLNISIVAYWYFFYKNKTYIPSNSQDQIVERQIKVKDIVHYNKDKNINEQNIIQNIEDIEKDASREFANLYIDNLLKQINKPRKKKVSKTKIDINTLTANQEKLGKEFKFKLDHINADAVGGLNTSNAAIEKLSPQGENEIDEVKLIDFKEYNNVTKKVNDLFKVNINFTDLPNKIQQEFKKIKFNAHIYLQDKKNLSWVSHKNKNYAPGSSINNFKIIEIKKDSAIFKYKNYIFEHKIII